MSAGDLKEAHAYEMRSGRLYRAMNATFDAYRQSLRDAGVDSSVIPDPVR